MKDSRYTYEDEKLRLIIEEDVVGYYLVVFDKNNSSTSVADYLLDTLEEAFVFADNKFKVSRSQWILDKSEI